MHKCSTLQYLSFSLGGAGEGKQELKPEGDMQNMQEVKSDEGLPFYCHPPNPCPKGYTGMNVQQAISPEHCRQAGKLQQALSYSSQMSDVT